MGGQICPQLFPFSWTPGGSDLLKNGLRIRFSQKYSNWDPLWVSQSLSSRDIAVWKKSFFLTFRRSEATLAPFVRVPPYENKAFLTNSVIPRPNGKLFDHEKWFLTYITFISHYTKIIRISAHWFFTGIRVCAGSGQICPAPDEIGLTGTNSDFLNQNSSPCLEVFPGSPDFLMMHILAPEFEI